MLACLLSLATAGLLAAGGCRDTLDPFDRLHPGPRGRLVVTDTLLADADSYIRQSTPNTNWGADTALQLGGGGRSRVLVRFDSTALRAVVGTGTLDSAWLEFTITAGPQGWGSNERTVDLHRLLRDWTELGATWNCAVDANTSNSVPDCPTQGWDMTNNGNGTYAPSKTDRVKVSNGQTGVLRLGVTADVAAFLGGTQLHQGWVFRKTSESQGGEAVIFSRESGSQPRLVVAISAVDTARPAVPPLGYPQDSSFLVQGVVDTSVVFYRRLAIVKFDDSTSGLTIQQFLTTFEATIVGGVPFVDEYVVQFPDGGPSLAVFKATLASMQQFAGVEYARPATFRSPAPVVDARFPNDGPGHRRQDWFTGGGTWAQRAVRAQFAWGCENGRYSSSSAKVGVLEWDFMTSHNDVQAPRGIFRPQALPGAPIVPRPDLSWHGTAVAGVLGATGDNDYGIAGMMWSADLHLYAMGSPGSGTGTVLQDNLTAFLGEVLPRIGTDGVRVLSISMELPRFSDTTGGSQSALVNGLRRLLVGSPDLLVTKAVGNDASTFTPQGLDSLTAGYAILGALSTLRRESAAFAARIIFVAGTEDLSNDAMLGNVLWYEGPLQGSNLISGETDLAAPAGNVDLLGGSTIPGYTGEVIVKNGTSFAAPMVAGLAAQLLTMRPTLTAAEVKTYILDGAQQLRFDSVTGTVHPPAPVAGAGGIYQLDAYGSLALLSGGPDGVGTPICGYDVRFVDSAVVLDRPSGPQSIYPMPTPYHQGNGSVSVAQGGRRIAVSSSINDTYSLTGPGVAVINHQGTVIHTIDSVHRRMYLERDTADIRLVDPQNPVWGNARPLLDLTGPGRGPGDLNRGILDPFVSGNLFYAGWIVVSPTGEYALAPTADNTLITCGGGDAGVISSAHLRIIPLVAGSPVSFHWPSQNSCAPNYVGAYAGNEQAAFSHDGRGTVFSVAFLDSDPYFQGNDVIHSNVYRYDFGVGTTSTAVAPGWYMQGPRFEADDQVLLGYDFDGLLPTAPPGGPCRAVARRANSLGTTIGTPQSLPLSACYPLDHGAIVRSNLIASRPPDLRRGWSQPIRRTPAPPGRTARH